MANYCRYDDFEEIIKEIKKCENRFWKLSSLYICLDDKKREDLLKYAWKLLKEYRKEQE